MELIGITSTVIVLFAMILGIVYLLWVNSSRFRQFIYDLQHIDDDDEPFDPSWMDRAKWEESRLK